MLGAIFFRIAVSVVRSYDPQIAGGVEAAARHLAAQFYFTAQFTDFFRARFPHHSWSQPRIAEGVDQRFDNELAVFWFAPGEKRVFDCRAERQSFDSLRGPIRGDLVAAHPPHLLGVGLEKFLGRAWG